MFKKIYNICFLFQQQILKKIRPFIFTANHDGVIHQSENRQYFIRLCKGTVGRQVAFLHTLLDFSLEKMVEFFNTTRKRRHICIVCVSHRSYLKINIRELGFFHHN